MPWKRAKKFLNCYKSNEAGLCPASTVAGLPAILFKDQIIQIDQNVFIFHIQVLLSAILLTVYAWKDEKCVLFSVDRYIFFR
jgi:hypothetical protein